MRQVRQQRRDRREEESVEGLKFQLDCFFVLAVRKKLELTLSSWRAVVKLKLEHIMRPQEITGHHDILPCFFSFFSLFPALP